MKTITMMAGELEFEDIFYGDTEILYPVTAHAMFTTFVVLVTVILTNLLVGLAVSDIQGLQASAGLDRLSRQVELVARLESLFFSRLLRKAPRSFIVVCQRSALLRTSRYHLQLCIRPNDPRDTRLPKDIVVAIYKLVAERRDRNQSMRRRRREQNLSFLPRREAASTATQQQPLNEGVQIRSNRSAHISGPRSVSDNLTTGGWNSEINGGPTTTTTPAQVDKHFETMKLHIQSVCMKLTDLQTTLLVRLDAVERQLNELQANLNG